MKGIILLLYVRDETYGKRLLRFLTGKKNPLLYPELVTAKERMEQRSGTGDKELVVLTDYAGIEKDDRRKVIYLSDTMDSSENKIFMYQKAEALYRELLLVLQMEKSVRSPARSGTGTERKAGVFCILDPDGRAGRALSILLAQYLGRQGKSLYLNLSGFPLYYGGALKEEPDFLGKGLGELFFCMDEERFAEHVGELVKPFGCAELIAPFPHYKDLLDCGIGEWEKLLRRLRRDCGYDSIVIELGQLFEYTLELMAQSEYPCLIENPGLCGRVQTAVFRHYCELEQKQALIRSCHMVQPFSEWESGAALLAEKTPEELGADEFLMGQVSEFLAGLQRGGDDDIIFEQDE